MAISYSDHIAVLKTIKDCDTVIEVLRDDGERYRGFICELNSAYMVLTGGDTEGEARII